MDQPLSNLGAKLSVEVGAVLKELYATVLLATVATPIGRLLVTAIGHGAFQVGERVHLTDMRDDPAAATQSPEETGL